jgi:hypothetical protein
MKLLGMHLWACPQLIDWEAIGWVPTGSFSEFLSCIYGRVYNCRVACDPETLSSGHGGYSRRSRHLAKAREKSGTSHIGPRLHCFVSTLSVRFTSAEVAAIAVDNTI